MTVDPLEIYGWLRVYYRQVDARPEFRTWNATEQWKALRTQILTDGPPGDEIRRTAIESIPVVEQATLLAWLDKSK
jgi:hypothetical protein